ncbi:MAG TPA: hypothetical protein VF552_09430 [Allosphingosinicella sp.]|jgi:hypothetical protein
MRLYLFAAAIAAMPLAAAPAAAQGANWRHEATGISLPRSIGDMSLSREQDASGGRGNDVILQYGIEGTVVTVYVYRSAYPNAAMWFERTRLAMNQHVGADAVAAAPRSFTLGGASAPNGLREEIALPGGRATGVAIAQIGPWMVKLRVTSERLDRAAVAERIDRLLAAFRFANPAPAPHPLTVPAPCGSGERMRGERLRNLNERNLAAASVVGLVALGHARAAGGGLAAEPSLWCRVTQTGLPVQYGSLYRLREGSGWVALVGDSGRAAAALPNLVPGDVRAVLFASTPSSTQVVAAYDGMPDPDQAIPVALPVVVGQTQGVVELSEEVTGGRPRGKD